MATSEENLPSKNFNPFMSLMRYKWLSMLIFIIMAGIGYAVLQQKTDIPVYSVQAKLLVSPTFVNNLTSDRGFNLHGNQYVLYVSQQEELIKRRDILQKVLNQPEMAAYWLQENESLDAGILRLRQNLKVRSDARRSPFITITLNNFKAEGLEQVLNSLLDIYIQVSQQEYFYDSDGRVQRLQEQKTQILAHIEQKHTQRSKIAEALGVTTFTARDLNPYDQILIDSNKAYAEAKRQRVEAEAQLAALEEKGGYKNQTALDSLVRTKLDDDAVFKSVKTNLARQRAESLAQIFGMKSTHPERQRVEQDIAELDRYLQQLEEQYASRIRRQIILDHQAQIHQAKQVELALLEELGNQSELATKYSQRYNQALALTNEIERAEKQLAVISDRIDFLASEIDAPGFVRVDTQARVPQLNPANTNTKLIAILIGLAVILGVGLPILLDALDKSIRSPSDVHRILGFPPLAWILEQRNQAAKQLSLDNLRRLALVLERDKKKHQTLCFALTSVKPAGGTSTLTLELANMLTQLGIKTLALELNAFKPDLRFKASHERGLTEVLIADNLQMQQLLSLIVPATNTLPDRLPVGTRHDDHLVTYGRLPLILNYLNQHYDLILIDSPPILLSADAELLGEVSGGVLLVIEANKVNPGELQRAAKLLERLDPPVVAAVINRVRPFKGGGYFNQLLKEYTSRAPVKSGLLKRLLWG
jgi:polysaccharide biosynthesis transport protein